MALNSVILNGRLANFEGKYIKGEGDKGSFYSWAMNVKRSYKKADEQYYKDDLIPIKVYGVKADVLNNNFSQGDGIIVTGRLQRDEDYEKDGVMIKGQLFLLVSDINFAEGKTSEKKAGTSSQSNSVSNNSAQGKAKPSLNLGFKR